MADRATDLLSIEQAARLIGVSQAFLSQRIVAGEIAVTRRVGTQRRLSRADVLAWQKQEATKAEAAFRQLAADLDEEIFGKR